jgi:hypothetical protein
MDHGTKLITPAKSCIVQAIGFVVEFLEVYVKFSK